MGVDPVVKIFVLRKHGSIYHMHGFISMKARKVCGEKRGFSLRSNERIFIQILKSGNPSVGPITAWN